MTDQTKKKRETYKIEGALFESIEAKCVAMLTIEKEMERLMHSANEALWKEVEAAFPDLEVRKHYMINREYSEQGVIFLEPSKNCCAHHAMGNVLDQIVESVNRAAESALEDGDPKPDAGKVH